MPRAFATAFSGILKYFERSCMERSAAFCIGMSFVPSRTLVDPSLTLHLSFLVTVCGCYYWPSGGYLEDVFENKCFVVVL